MTTPYSGIWRDTVLLREIRSALKAAGQNVAEIEQRLESESTDSSYIPAPGSTEEAIVLGVGRPSLFVQDDTFSVPRSDVWKRRLEASKPAIGDVLRSVGRVQLGKAPGARMIGTGWLLAPDVIVTNRHVARVFADSENGWAFKPEAVDPMLDFKAEFERAVTDSVDMAKVIHVEADDGPDVALVRLARPLNRPPIELATRIFGPEDVAVIGYPAWDGKRNPGPEMGRIFGEVFEVKRLAPGTLLNVSDRQLEHDCSTLGGNSGSVVWGLQAHKALGLHFAGRFHERNFAVPAPVIETIASAHRVL